MCWRVEKMHQNSAISQITQTEHNTIHSSGSASAPPPPLHSSTTSSFPSFLWFLSCSLQFLVSSDLWMSLVFVFGILLSPGPLNQDMITLRSSRFQCSGLSPFALAWSKLSLASALACCHLLAAAIAFSSFFLWICGLIAGWSHCSGSLHVLWKPHQQSSVLPPLVLFLDGFGDEMFSSCVISMLLT